MVLEREYTNELRDRRGGRERTSVHDMIGASAHLASKYVHEDRPVLKETLPWEETKLVHAQFSHIVWYIPKVIFR